MPTTASPDPSSNPSRIDAAIPSASSVGWFGCSRALSLPANPTVVRKRVTTRIFAAAAIRSCTRISLLTAATISGVSPGAMAASRSGVASSESSQFRNSPTVNERTAANASALCVSTISRVTSSLAYGTICSSRKCTNGKSASANCAATRSSAEPAAIPASTSPLRKGAALANSSRKLPNV